MDNATLTIALMILGIIVAASVPIIGFVINQIYRQIEAEKTDRKDADSQNILMMNNAFGEIKIDLRHIRDDIKDLNRGNT